jgi:hypothetical protein
MNRPSSTPDELLERPAAADSSESAEPVADEPWIDRKASALATRAAHARQASGRRRFVDPATCERDYAADELEFMNAMQEYKRRSGRMFPTWSEVLEVLHSLGYHKEEAPSQAAS